MDENSDLVLKHLRKLNIYDLERLKVCFLYEYETEPENREDILAIIENIEIIMHEKMNEITK